VFIDHVGRPADEEQHLAPAEPSPATAADEAVVPESEALA
jgi:hypothetical protein